MQIGSEVGNRRDCASLPVEFSLKVSLPHTLVCQEYLCRRASEASRLRCVGSEPSPVQQGHFARPTLHMLEKGPLRSLRVPAPLEKPGEKKALLSLLNHQAQRQSQDIAPRGAQPPTQVFQRGSREKQLCTTWVARHAALASAGVCEVDTAGRTCSVLPSTARHHVSFKLRPPSHCENTGRDRAHENAHRYSMKSFRNFYLHPLELSKTPAADRRGDRTRSSPTLAQHFPAMSEITRGFLAPDSLDSKLSTDATTLLAAEIQRVERGSQFPRVNAQRDWRYQPTVWRD